MQNVYAALIYTMGPILTIVVTSLLQRRKIEQVHTLVDGQHTELVKKLDMQSQIISAQTDHIDTLKKEVP
jgi:hypothetical protein